MRRSTAAAGPWYTSGCSPFDEGVRVVGVAERLRRQVVALENEGSNPSVHPTDGQYLVSAGPPGAVQPSYVCGAFAGGMGSED